MKKMNMVFKVYLLTILSTITIFNSGASDICSILNTKKSTKDRVEFLKEEVTQQQFFKYRDQKAADDGRWAGLCSALFFLGMVPALQGKKVDFFSSSSSLIAVGLTGLLSQAVSSYMHKKLIIDPVVEYHTTKCEDASQQDTGQQLVRAAHPGAFIDAFTRGVLVVLLPYVAYRY